MSEVHNCDCICLGCASFHRSSDLAEGQDAHHTRLLLALDVSFAVACRSRGIVACSGIDDDESCEVGTLHTRAAGLAIAIEEPSDVALVERVASALRGLLAELVNVIAGKARVS
jgi:hypothetical protein